MDFAARRPQFTPLRASARSLILQSSAPALRSARSSSDVLTSHRHSVGHSSEAESENATSSARELDLIGANSTRSSGAPRVGRPRADTPSAQPLFGRARAETPAWLRVATLQLGGGGGDSARSDRSSPVLVIEENGRPRASTPLWLADAAKHLDQIRRRPAESDRLTSSVPSVGPSVPPSDHPAGLLSRVGACEMCCSRGKPLGRAAASPYLVEHRA